jgi:hypothetical protein
MKKLSILIVCLLSIITACGNKDTVHNPTNGTDTKETADVKPNDDETKEEGMDEEQGTDDGDGTHDEQTEDEDGVSQDSKQNNQDSNGKDSSLDDKQTTVRKIVKVDIKDESSHDPELKIFMEKLTEVAAAKDKNALLNMMTDKIQFSFGAENGKEAFIQQWGLDKNPQQSTVWKELRDVLSHGGSLGDNQLYTAPYIFTKFPEGYDHFQYGAILGRNVILREKPSIDSKTIMQLSYEVVEMSGEYSENTIDINGDSYHWVKIRTLDGNAGYVAEKYARNPVDYRIGVQEQADGNWKIVFFIAGD